MSSQAPLQPVKETVVKDTSAQHQLTSLDKSRRSEAR
jgi:hypothetical protein